MNPEMIHKDRDEIIERYLRNELSDMESDIFEEHLLSCAECRNEITQKSRIFDSIERFAAIKTFQTGKERDKRSKKLSPLIWYVAAAAGVALVIGLFLLPNRDNPPAFPQKVSEETEVDTTDFPEKTEDEMAGVTETSGQDRQALPKKKIANLAAFQVNPVYENQIGIYTRSGNLTVVSPGDSIDCIVGSKVEIRYRGAVTDSLFLVMLDNLGEVLFEEKIASPYSFHMQFSEGLYYWQLTNEEEALHTAKIIIR